MAWKGGRSLCLLLGTSKCVRIWRSIFKSCQETSPHNSGLLSQKESLINRDELAIPSSSIFIFFYYLSLFLFLGKTVKRNNTYRGLAELRDRKFVFQFSVNNREGQSSSSIEELHWNSIFIFIFQLFISENKQNFPVLIQC